MPFRTMEIHINFVNYTENCPSQFVSTTDEVIK